MKKVIEILSHASNAAIIQLPERKFPGLVLQGDSLHILCTLVDSALNKAKLSSELELTEELSELKQILDGYLESYENTLNQHNIVLPYHKKNSA